MEKTDKILAKFSDEINAINTEIDIKRRNCPMCIAIANRIINRTNAHNLMRRAEGRPPILMNGKRLQKVLYLCQLEWLAEGNRNYLISDDFEAWAKGPVVASIYDVFSIYQDGDMFPYRSKNKIIQPLTDKERNVINYVVDSTIDIDTDTIIEFTHTPGGPWDQAYKNRNQNERRPVISKENIRAYIDISDNREILRKFLERGVLPQ